MKQIILIISIVICCHALVAQERENELRGTIKVQKTGQLVKVLYDNVNYRLIGIDQFGNVLDSAVVEFQMSVTIQGLFYNEKTVGFRLSYQMQQLLGKCDQSAEIFFDKIKAKDRSGNIVEIPKFKYSLGSRNDFTY